MDVVSLGLMVCDILVKPITKDILDRDSTRVEFVKMSSGGDALNVAINLSKMGVSSAVIGKVGNDGFGGFLLDTANKNRINTKGVVVTGDYGTSTSVVLIHPDGERSFAYYGGTTDEFKEEDIDYGIIKDARILSVGSAFGLPGLDGDGLVRVLKWSQESGVQTVLDVTGNPEERHMQIIRPALRYTNIFIPSYVEVKSLTGKEEPEEIARVLRDEGVQLVVIKLGSKGCYICSNDEALFVPAFKVNAVDCTGAGDSFVAGFITAYSKGWPLYECGRFANAAGALCVQEVGATSGIKTLEEVLTFMKSSES